MLDYVLVFIFWSGVWHGVEQGMQSHSNPAVLCFAHLRLWSLCGGDDFCFSWVCSLNFAGPGDCTVREGTL